MNIVTAILLQYHLVEMHIVYTYLSSSSSESVVIQFLFMAHFWHYGKVVC